MDVKKVVMIRRLNQGWTFMKNYVRPALIFAFAYFFFLSLHACKDDGLKPTANAIPLNPKLSDYNIFQGEAAALTPSTDFHVYELATELFTDYAEKQRLIKVPTGTTLKVVDGGLPDFPEGTMLVKTFYYYNDKRDPSKGKKIIETRLEIKSNSKWNVGTYLWNEQQTDAALITTGLSKTINWINDKGEGNVIAYHIPSTRECATCHNASDAIIPIGPKFRNMNIEVTRNSAAVNQLTHLYSVRVLEEVDPASIPVLPRWKDSGLALDERARAYLDVNCAHCHNTQGIASGTKLNFAYDTPFESTNIPKRKNAIISKIKSGQMPKLGTSIVHEEGLELIIAYMKSL
jgi:uncharacterized repeat protein (TIGR03806 family)